MVGRGASRVPERWTDYIPLGCRMPGTRFIAFKVPLKESFDQNLLPEERFSPHDLIRRVRERQEELGLIIDLTYTGRYYGPEELPPTLRYCKILTMGHQIPNRKTFMKFRYLVRKFLTDNKHNDKLIGVHCTHGLNRTGYLVCRYLIDVEGMEPNAAIELFNKSRGHPIERTNYIQDLQRRALKKSCEVKKLGSDLIRKKGSAPAKPQKQLVNPPRSQTPLAVPRNPGSAKRKQQQPEPRAQGQPQELGHGHRQLEQRQVKKLEQRQFEKLEQRQQKKLEQRQQKKLKKKLEQRQLEKHNHLEQKQQNHLEQRQKKLKDLEQNQLEQRQLEQHNHLEQRQQRQQNHLEQRQQKKRKHLEQNHLDQRQNHLEQRQLEQHNHLEQKQQNHLEQRQQKKLKDLEQNHLEQKQQRQQNHLEQRQQKKRKHLEQRQLDQRHNHLEQKQQNHLEQNHLDQRQNHLEQKQQNNLEQRQQNHLDQRQHKKQRHLEQNPLEQRQLEKPNPLEQRQPCSLPPRNCWLPAAPRKQHKELFLAQSPQAWLPQGPCPGRRHSKHKLQGQERP